MSVLDDRYGPGTTMRLRDISGLCARAEQLAARGRAWYDSDAELAVPHLAAESLVLKIGEAVRRLPSGFIDERRGDPTWRRAVGMRHRLAHEYDAVDYELVWAVIATHAGHLRRQIDTLIGSEGDSQEGGSRP